MGIHFTVHFLIGGLNRWLLFEQLPAIIWLVICMLSEIFKCPVSRSPRYWTLPSAISLWFWHLKTKLVNMFGLVLKPWTEYHSQNRTGIQVMAWIPTICKYDDHSKFKYSGCLQSGLFWILNGHTAVGLQMVRVSNVILNLETPPFEIRTNGLHFGIKHLKSGKNCNREFENQTWSRLIYHLKTKHYSKISHHQRVWKSHTINVFGIWAPTALYYDHLIANFCKKKL